MATAEYENFMTPVEPIENSSIFDKFKQTHENAKTVTFGEIKEIERFKSIMDRLISIENDVSLIKKHFNIVPIIGDK